MSLHFFTAHVSFLTYQKDDIASHYALKHATYEQIACLGLKQKYNGTPAELILMLNLIHICHQNKKWYPATFIQSTDSTKMDLVHHFSIVTHAKVLARAKLLWDSPTVMQDRHTRGSDSYSARLLIGVLLSNSLTNDFFTLQSHRSSI
jgi:hypothetical protein